MENRATYGVKKKLRSRYLGRQKIYFTYDAWKEVKAGPRKKTWKLFRMLKTTILRGIFSPMMETVYGEQGITMNFMNYTMKQI
jgi:hypothetical protein